MYRALADAVTDAVADELARLQREAEREREVREAQFAARMAELETRIASVAEIERRMGEKLATLKDGEPGKSVTVEDVLPALTEAAERAAARKVESVLASWERPKNGKDYDPEEMLAAITEAVAAIPKPKDGAPGIGITEIKIIDTDLIITLSDGGKFQGRVVGWDGVDCDFEKVNERIAADIKALWDACPKPKDGKDGKLPIAKTWEDRVYYEGDVVTFNGSMFQAARDTGKAPGHEDWNCIVRAGKDGENGKSLAIRGTWNETADYDELDIVSLNGAMFGAKHDNPGPCPGDGWQLLAAQGKRGKPGEPGKPGVGLRGLPGAPVKRAEISDDGLLTLHNGDGSTVECDLYPLLSKIEG